MDPFEDRNDPDTAKENERVKDLVAWFLTHHEDPVENCPVEGGVYEYIWGGPVEDVGAELQTEFPNADETDILRAVEILDTCDSAGSWAKKPPPMSTEEELGIDVEQFDEEGQE